MRELINRLLGVDPDKLAQGRWTLRFTAAWPAWLTAAAVVLVAWGVFRLYRHEAGPASRRARRVLAVLRCLLLSLLILMLFRPVLSIEKSLIKDSYVLLLIDESLSMGIKDRYTEETHREQLAAAAGLEPDSEAFAELTRAELVSRVLNDPRYDLCGRLAAICKLKVYTFDAGARAVPGSAPQDDPPAGPYRVAIKPQGALTKIGDSLRDAIVEVKGQRIAGVVLISDGRSNSGQPPIGVAEHHAADREDPFPIFTVGVGDPVPPKDVEIQELAGRRVVFVDDFADLNVTVRSEGYEGETITIELLQDGSSVATKQVTLQGGREQQDVGLRFKPSRTGRFTFVARAPAQPGEITTENNSASHLMEVVDEKIKLLYVAGGPSWEYRYLKNALTRDHSIQTSILLQSADHEFHQEGNIPIQFYPSSPKALSEYHCILFMDVNASLLRNAELANTARFVQDQGGGFLFAAGSLNSPGSFRNTEVEAILPVALPTRVPAHFASPSTALTHDFRLRLTPEGQMHPIMQLAKLPRENLGTWANLPRLFWYYPALRPKPGADVLAVHPEARNEHGNLPLIALQFCGAGRSMFVGLDSSWRWRFAVGDRYFYRFWAQAVRFLGAGRLLRPSNAITTDKDRYTVSQTVNIAASLDEFDRPSERDRIAVLVTRKGRPPEKLELQAVRPGIYRGSFVPTMPGTYELSLAGDPRRTSIAKVKKAFAVGMPSLEFDNPRMDKQTLVRMAKVSGGAFFTLDQIGQIPERIQEIKEEIFTEVEDELWDSPLLFIVFCAIIILEWAFRKRKLMM